ncbi:MAG: TCR/Tet family MFS transporter [Pseudarcicella sp.]|nr:TCR/Tet family MFS transporter [Pseudarcicella sp.]MBP6411457.1 TCR/Tet family MFS transporter [Pseudarcicella sp.]
MKYTSKAKAPTIFFIFITMLIDVIGIGLIIPVLPTLVKSFTGDDISKAAQYSGWMMASYAIMQFIFSPILGGLSDKYGRRPVILFSLFGFALDYLLLGFAPSLVWLFVGRCIAGITGASFTTANAYIADISKPEDRSKNYGMVGAAFGLGFILGPMLGGILGHYGAKVPFFFAAGLTFINGLYGYFILPESLKPENRRDFDWKRANPMGTLLILKKYPQLIWLLTSFLLLQLAGQTHPSIWTFFTMKQFGWTPKEVGLSLAFVGLIIGVVQGGLIRFTTPKLGEKKSIIYGLILYLVGFILFAFAAEGWMMYAIMIPFGLGGICGPSLQALITKQVGEDQQGELQGGITSLQSITTIFGPLMASNLFAYFTSNSAPILFPGAAFFSAGLLTLLSVLVVFNYFKNHPSV